MGGGARWFFSRHLAFGFDVRFYLTRPEEMSGTIPGRGTGAAARDFGRDVSIK